MGRRFGFECELTGGTQRTLDNLRAEGLIREARLHQYHCDRECCSPFNERHSFHAQSDCSVEGEIILNVHEHGSDRADRAISGLAKALRQARAFTGTNGGFHVHVDRGDLDDQAIARVFRLFLRYQDTMAELASASFEQVRNYNAPLDLNTARRHLWRSDDTVLIPSFEAPRIGGRGNWLWATHYDTFEFRLWNATIAEWRMRLAVGMSVALVDAAEAGVDVDLNDPRPLEDVIGQYMDDGAWAGVLRQRYSKGGLVA